MELTASGFLDYIYFFAVDKIYKTGSSMDPSSVQEAIDEFHGRIYESGKLLESKSDEMDLPQEYLDTLKKKRKPSNWYSGKGKSNSIDPANT